jgi:REP element-mobilizing transposase RayT
MASERVYYHVVFSTTRGKPVFLDEEVDAAFKHVAHEIARQKGWLLLEKAPWDDLSQMVGYLKGRAARPLHAPPAPSVGHAETTPLAEGVRYCAAFMVL